MNETGDDTGLIGRFQEGDPDAFRELFEPCEGALRRHQGTSMTSGTARARLTQRRALFKIWRFASFSGLN